MPEVRISVDASLTAVIHEAEDSSGVKVIYIHLNRRTAAADDDLSMPRELSVAETIAQIDQRIADALSKPPIIRGELRRRQMMSSKRSTAARSIVETSGLDAIRSNTSRSFSISRASRSLHARITPAIKSSVRFIVRPIMACNASNWMSSIVWLLAGKQSSNPKPVTPAQTTDSEKRDA